MRIFFAFLIVLAGSAFFLWPNIFDFSKLNFQKKSIIGAQNFKNDPRLVENFQPQPEISARSAVIIDAAGGLQLYEKNPDIKHLPASTTKLMTALIVLENCDLARPIKIEFVEKEGTQMGLNLDDIVTVETLLYGMLIASGNDAAYALASACNTTHAQFVDLMNLKAQELGMESSHFANPAGFDSDLQYSTARDLAKLAKVAVSNPIISKIVATKSTVRTDITQNKTYLLENINKLLGVIDGIEGVKTGQTEGSGEILISKVTRDHHSIIAVIMGSVDRFEESQKLIEWTFKNYRFN